MPFKFDAKKVFLTYAQSGDITKDQIVNHLQSIKPVTWLRIARELHEDGQPHYHVIAEFSGRLQSQNERLFDVAGKHPNIQPVRSVAKSLAYIAKDGEFDDIGPVPSGGDSDTDWISAAATLSEAEYFKQALRSNIGYMYAKHFWALGNRQTNEIPVGYEGDISRECFELVCLLPAESKSTVIVGATGCGKSSWAKRVCQKPALWVRHIDMLRSFRKDYHRSIVFDDMSFTHLPRETQIQITDWHDESHIHCRYGVAIIPPHVPKIFTANFYPFDPNDEAVNRRVYKYEIANPQI